jgi:predicted solute-binding protein
MLHGAQRDLFDLEFALPAECADRLKNGRADIGIVPAAALLDQDLRIFRGAGIACRGAVRSILLISKEPPANIRVLAADSSSRSSVLLARIILNQVYETNPEFVSMLPDLASMLDAADAALIIGDPALRLDPATLREEGFYVADLGEEWLKLTGLPMVFAVWAGRPLVWTAERERGFVSSCRFGTDHLDDIVATEHAARGIGAELAKTYLTRHIVFELGDFEYEGLRRYLEYAADVARAPLVSPEGISV